jgi:hypothetical protein
MAVAEEFLHRKGKAIRSSISTSSINEAGGEALIYGNGSWSKGTASLTAAVARQGQDLLGVHARAAINRKSVETIGRISSERQNSTAVNRQKPSTECIRVGYSKGTAVDYRRPVITGCCLITEERPVQT